MVLEVKNVDKSYGRRQILWDISFHLKEGEICGFIGPNGAGKTTMLKIITNLVHATKGSCKICGHDIAVEPTRALGLVGAVIENPELYGYLSGRTNLEMNARLRGVSKERIQEVIQLVGLTGRINDKVKRYSLGMKQRLGIAIALLSKPALLILDEPTNGLDPRGISDLRHLLKKVAQEDQCAILISSHQLSEVEQIVSKLVFIDKGHITAQEDLKNYQEENRFYTLKFDTTPDDFNNLLAAIPTIVSFHAEPDGYRLIIKPGRAHETLAHLMAAGVTVNDFHGQTKHLEDRYFELMKEGTTDARPNA